MITITTRAALLLSGAILASPAVAETAAETAADQMPGVAIMMETQGDDILVTGDILQSSAVNSVKTPTPIINVPQSLTITTEQEILDRGFTSIGQIVDYTPGVNTSQGEGHRDAIVFRGVRSTADFFIDGVRDDVQYYRGLYNLQQVEILRGPNALLFGRGGAGGVLNRVTKKGIVGEVFAGGQVAVDTFGEVGVFGDVNYALGESAALRVNAAYESLDNHRDFYDGERIGINPTLRLALGEGTVVDLSYEYADHERFVDRGIPTGADGRPVEALEEITFGDAIENFTDLEAHLLRANVQHDFSDSWKGVFSAFYGDYDKAYSNFFSTDYDPATNIVELDGYVDDTQRENLILTSNIVGEFATGAVRHTLLIGGEYISTSSDQFRLNSFFSTSQDDRELFVATRPIALRGNVGVNAFGEPTVNTFSDLNDFTQVEIDVVSLYVQDEIEVADWLILVAGGRYDSFDIEVFNVPAGELRTRRDEEISPRGGAIFKPQDNVSIYASYSQSFLPRSGEQFANINGAAAALDPDEFVNLEAGIKWDLAERLSLTAAIFEIEQSSPQPNDDDPATLDVIDSRIQGLEFQFQGEVLPGWIVSAGYSFLDGEQVDRLGPTGLRPRELPEHMASIWNRVQVTDRLGLGLGVTHQGSSFIDNSNTAILPDYTRFDAAAFYDVAENLRLQVNIENLTDELYFPNSHATHQASVGAPFNARFAVSASF
ncbi:TonB-dependent receptor [Erythrobacter sp.]|jgi:catecholate siderophore receptor|uniref:TonB-dependent receptor n=1 Tax=Erythrobacter sp. TaxID=1042 RepID=UPI002EBAD96B|nr:TonB-dependent siderophore receptor [Erythrobacter sp.]